MTPDGQFESVLDSLIALLNSASETTWRNSLEKLKARWQVTTSSEKRRELLSEVLGTYGGMGSFSDLVLYRGDKVLGSQTQQLDQLRKQLHDIVKNAL